MRGQIEGAISSANSDTIFIVAGSLLFIVLGAYFIDQQKDKERGSIKRKITHEAVTARPLGVTRDIKESGIYQAFMKKSSADLIKAVEYLTKQRDADLTGFDKVTKDAIISQNEFKLAAAKLALQDKLKEK